MVKRNKDEKKLIKKVKKMKAGEEICLNNYTVLCYDKEFYLLINPCDGIKEKHFNEIRDWIIDGGELD